MIKAVMSRGLGPGAWGLIRTRFAFLKAAPASSLPGQQPILTRSPETKRGALALTGFCTWGSLGQKRQLERNRSLDSRIGVEGFPVIVICFFLIAYCVQDLSMCRVLQVLDPSSHCPAAFTSLAYPQQKNGE